MEPAGRSGPDPEISTRHESLTRATACPGESISLSIDRASEESAAREVPGRHDLVVGRGRLRRIRERPRGSWKPRWSSLERHRVAPHRPNPAARGALAERPIESRRPRASDSARPTVDAHREHAGGLETRVDRERRRKLLPSSSVPISSTSASETSAITSAPRRRLRAPESRERPACFSAWFGSRATRAAPAPARTARRSQASPPG